MPQEPNTDTCLSDPDLKDSVDVTLGSPLATLGREVAEFWGLCIVLGTNS